ncbi:NAD(P)/FAD-dependent oxidoreductase [Elongatibacter sediminis]|uniref:FAD-binding oxidoreductase n=1 Tax=Elongatibacter sediminis TaxID=3119006 RepID=A0AAW9RJS2_9GAMM
MKENHQYAEHTDSYYAATAENRTDYPALKGAQSADIAIVGGGFTGVSTALTLAERGYRVALIEANRIGWGASGRNGGQLICGISGEEKIARHHGDAIADELWDLRWRGHEIIFDRIVRYGIECDLKCGYVDAAIKPRHLRALEADFARLQRRNFPYEHYLLDRDGMAETLGTRAYCGGLVNMRNGHLHPLNLCQGEARAAVSLGASVFEHSPATRIVHGSRPRVETAHGHIEADAVVLAGHVFHRLEQDRLSGTTFPAGSFIMATEPLSETVRRRINPLDLAVCDMNNIIDYYRLSADGRLLFGGRCNYSGRVPASISAVLRPRLARVYPELRDVRTDYEWGGSIGIAILRIPLLGRINGNVYYAQGYSGHGVNATHIMGEIIADAIGGTLEHFDLFANMRRLRLPVGTAVGGQMVALGMLYYRMKDLL